MTSRPIDHLAEPEIWQSVLPPDVYAGFRRWAAAQPFRIYHVRPLTDGRSGSYVAVVRIHPENDRMRHAVLKLLPPNIGQAETLGVRRAEKHTPQPFWDRHMVPTIDESSIPGTDWWVHTQQVANANLAQMRPLAERIDEPWFAELCGTIVEAIVDGWHQSADPDPLPCTPQSFLDAFLNEDHREGLSRFATETDLSIDNPPDSVTVPGRGGELPNPFALWAGRGPNGPVDIYVANGHGDLQLFNVLVPPNGSAVSDDFRLIDYGRFDPHTPISRDPIKLLLSVATTWLRPLRSYTALRSSVAELIVDPEEHSAAPVAAGYLALATRVHRAASRWAEPPRDMPVEWRRQHLLVLIGSALRTVADTELDLADRWWFFEVAALAIRAYGEPETRHPATPPSLKRVLKTEPATSTQGTHIPVTAGPVRYSGFVKVHFARRLGQDWSALADMLDIPSYAQRQFSRGDEARAVWEWLEVRDRLGEISAALERIGRVDLADQLRNSGT